TAIQVPFRACPRRLLPLPRGLLLVFFALGLVGVGGGARHLRDLGRDLGLGLRHAGGAARGGGSGGVGPFGLLGRGGGFLDGALGAGDRHGQGLGGGGGLRGSLLGRGAVDAAAHLDDHVRQAGGDQLDGADGVVVAGDDVVEHVGVGVGVGERHHRDAQLVGLLHRDRLLGGVDDEEGVGQAVQVA